MAVLVVGSHLSLLCLDMWPRLSHRSLTRLLLTLASGYTYYYYLVLTVVMDILTLL